jgi:hypothetical protein
VGRITLILAAFAAATGLVAIDETSFDEAAAKPGALAAVRRIFVAPPTIAYSKQPVRSDPIYRDEDWQLRPDDLAHLQKLFVETFREELAARGLEVVDKPAPDVARMTTALVDVRLTAPLHEDSSVTRTFVESIGDLTLEATFRGAGPETIATVRDARRNVQISAAGNRGIRFTSTLYWSEVKHVFRSWAKATAALFPEPEKKP